MSGYLYTLKRQCSLLILPPIALLLTLHNSLVLKTIAHAIDPERSPDYRLWLEATRKEYELLDKTMGCWEVVDIDTLPQDANLIGVKWVFKLKYKNGEYE
jgi:hypothetical protein